MNKKVAIYCLLLMLVLNAACKKLPRETHKGKNKMGCYVNGDKWVAKDKIFPLFNFNFGGSGANPGATLVSSDSILYIHGSTRQDNDGAINIRIYRFSGVGEYEITDSQSLSAYAEYALSGGWNYSTDSTHKGNINVKYYTDKIVAGTFFFNAINTNGETISITDGRFDIEYELK